MPLILLIVLLTALRFFEVWRFAELSWWYVIGLMLFAFTWFEFVEKLLGLDKRKEHNVQKKRQQQRVKETFK
jgi:small Trp-rich protein